MEDEELESNQMTEGMPTTMTGFKDHPLYVHIVAMCFIRVTDVIRGSATSSLGILNRTKPFTL